MDRAHLEKTLAVCDFVVADLKNNGKLLSNIYNADRNKKNRHINCKSKSAYKTAVFGAIAFALAYFGA